MRSPRYIPPIHIAFLLAAVCAPVMGGCDSAEDDEWPEPTYDNHIQVYTRIEGRASDIYNEHEIEFYYSDREQFLLRASCEEQGSGCSRFDASLSIFSIDGSELRIAENVRINSYSDGFLSSLYVTFPDWTDSIGYVDDEGFIEFTRIDGTIYEGIAEFKYVMVPPDFEPFGRARARFRFDTSELETK